MEAGVLLLASLVEAGEIDHFFSWRLEEKHFFGEEVPLFRFVRDHVSKYGKLPSLATVKQQFGLLPKSVEPSKFYLDLVQDRFRYKRLNKVLTECNELMKQQDSWTTSNLLLEALTEVRADGARTSLSDFGKDAPEWLEREYKRVKLAGNKPGVMLGWPTLDKMCNGLRPGDLLSLVGRPAQGKTFLTLCIARHGWQTQGRNVLLVSMEMDRLTIMQRLAAIETGVNVGEIRSGELTTALQATFFKKLGKVGSYPGRLIVVDGNLNATVPDIFALAYQFNIEALCIDGAYMLKHPDRKLDKYRRVEANIEEIKQRCSDLGIPAVLSYQFSREAVKKQKKGGTVGLEDIAFSDSIGQTSSIVLGLFEQESVETLKRREVRILKGRSGEIGKFHVRWDFNRMDFTEIVEESTEELTFL
jgi:replicative DNA helicase